MLQSLAHLGSTVDSMQDTVKKVEPFIKATNSQLDNLTKQIQDVVSTAFFIKKFKKFILQGVSDPLLMLISHLFVIDNYEYSQGLIQIFCLHQCISIKCIFNFTCV